MLIEDIARYLASRQSLGFKIRVPASQLRRFGEFAAARGDAVVRSATAIEWAAEAPSPAQRLERLLIVRRFAMYMQAEDLRYQVPPARAFGAPARRRRTPHIYTLDEIRRLLRAAATLTPVHSTRPSTYVALLSLLFSTGLRISEALALRIDDVTPDGLVVRETKFRKSRLVPLHPTTRVGLERYLARRRRIGTSDSAVFLSLWGGGLHYATVLATFLHIARSAGVRGGPGTSGARLHDARHTFAVRALESCSPDRVDISRHMLALSTYLGHAHPSDTYWYLQATPKLMADIACAGESTFTGGGA
jgi:integrase